MNRPLNIARVPVPRDEEVLSLLEQEWEAHPEWPDMQNRWGLLCLSRGDLHGADAAFTSALERNPNYAWARANRAVLTWIRGNEDAARAMLDEVEGLPEPAAALIRGWWAVTAERPREGLAALRGLSRAHQHRADVLWLKSALSELDDPSSANTLWQELVDEPHLRDDPGLLARVRAGDGVVSGMYPGFHLLWHSASNLFARLGRRDDAEDAARIAYLLFSDRADLLNRYGFAAEFVDDRDGARRQYEAALSASDTDPIAAASLARLWSEMDELERAHHYLRLALERAPKYADLLRLMGQVEGARGHLAEALSYTRRALEVNPRYRTARIEEAYLLFRLGIWSEAQASFARAEADGFCSADMLLHRGRCLEHLGRDADAQACYEQVVAQTPDEVLAHYRLSRLHARRGETARAEEIWHRVQSLVEGGHVPLWTDGFEDPEQPLPLSRAA